MPDWTVEEALTFLNGHLRGRWEFHKHSDEADPRDNGTDGIRWTPDVWIHRIRFKYEVGQPAVWLDKEEVFSPCTSLQEACERLVNENPRMWKDPLELLGALDDVR